jgi:type IV fimbrial biogenesis protein FimT
MQLAEVRALVVFPMARSSRPPRAARGLRASRREAEGFSLLELMTVVSLVAILAVLAIPSMGSAKMDRHAYDDAGNVMQIFRVARTRSLARGAAVLVHMQADLGAQRGRYEIWEAVTANPTGNGLNRVPVSTCKSPTQWTLSANSTNAAFVDAADMNGAIEGTGGILSQIIDPFTAKGVTEAFLCYTPLGRVYYSAGSTPNFDSAAPMTATLQVQVTRGGTGAANKGPLRTVLVPGASMARLVSQ